MTNAFDICRALQDAGFIALYVGGCVRDRMLGETPKDYDVVTNALPEQAMEALRDKFSVNPVGEAFGVILASKGGEDVEIATFREETGYSDQRHPDKVAYVTSSDVHECVRRDSARRDLRFNAIYLDPTLNHDLNWEHGNCTIFDSALYDPQNGAADVEARRVQFIGQPFDRISEDPLRMLRFVRFCARFDCDPCPEACRVIKDYGALVADVSAERQRDELTKILTGNKPGDALLLLQQLGLLQYLLPEVRDLTVAPRCNQFSDYHPEGTVFAHTILMLNGLKDDDPILAWGTLLHDVAKPETYELQPSGKITNKAHAAVGASMSRRLLQRLKCPNDFIDGVCALVKHHMDFMQAKDMKLSTRKRMYARPTFDLELELHRVDCRYSNGRLDNWVWVQEDRADIPPEVVKPQPFVNGRDVMALGIEPGPAIGQILSELEELQLNEEVTDREQALSRLGELCRDRG